MGRIRNVPHSDEPELIYSIYMRDGIFPLSVALLYFSTYATLPTALLLIIMPFLIVGTYYLIWNE
ncbi:MAG: hypothetical protein Q8N08_02365 [Methanobacteriaceae archaeon]|nr:hypothetical protein [Methanobacteriaceae archaeon]